MRFALKAPFKLSEHLTVYGMDSLMAKMMEWSRQEEQAESIRLRQFAYAIENFFSSTRFLVAGIYWKSVQHFGLLGRVSKTQDNELVVDLESVSEEGVPSEIVEEIKNLISGFWKDFCDTVLELRKLP